MDLIRWLLSLSVQELTTTCTGPGQVIPMQCDLTNESEILATFARIRSELGGVDVCVNNAGLAKNAPLLSGTTDQWREMFDVGDHYIKEADSSNKLVGR